MPCELWLDETKEVPTRVRGWSPENQTIINPTSAVVTVGFSRMTPSGRSRRPTTFFPAVWSSSPDLNQFWANILVGPSGVVQLTAGKWIPWIRFVLGQETVVQPADDIVTVR